MEQYDDSCEELFCDSDFPASKESLYEDPDDPKKEDYHWMRPREMIEDPQIFVDGVSRADVAQGALGDCWFLSACSAIAQIPELINRVIPPNQVLDGEGYTGKLTFNFWSMGEWKTVEIDDRLPVDEEGRLVYATCTAENEFWLPLLEKAFAKFHGNYEILDEGQLGEGFVNLTGFFVESVGTDVEDKNQLYRRLRVEHKYNSLLTCSSPSLETQGVPGDHAYTITDLKRMPCEGRLLRMVRVRNPWGICEWTGAWCDGDSRWDSIDEAVKEEIGYNRAEDGEYWMEFADFIKTFEAVCIAIPVPALGESRADGTASKMFVIHDSWRIGVNAGGSHYDILSFATNPQYLLSVEEGDDPESESEENGEEDSEEHKEEDGEENGEEDSEGGIDNGQKKTCLIRMDLMQEHRRNRYRSFNKIALIDIKTQKDERLTVSDLQEKAEELTCQEYEYIPDSSVSVNLELHVGEKYVVIPATYEPNQERKFLLRIFSRKPVNVQELLP